LGGIRAGGAGLSPARLAKEVVETEILRPAKQSAGSQDDNFVGDPEGKQLPHR